MPRDVPPPFGMPQDVCWLNESPGPSAPLSASDAPLAAPGLRYPEGPWNDMLWGFSMEACMPVEPARLGLLGAGMVAIPIPESVPLSSPIILR